MKKISLILSLLVIIFCFASCDEKSKTPTIPTTNRPFSSNVKISYKDLAYSGFLTFRNSGSATLEITEPKNLEGLIFNLSNGELTAKYEGLDFPLDTLDAKAKTAAGMIFSALASAGTSSDIKLNEEKSEFSVSGQIYSRKYDMIFDYKSGAVKSFCAPEERLSVSFENFSFLG